MGLALTQLAPASEDRAAGGQIIDNGLRFDDNGSTYLNRTPSSAGNQKTWTFSAWLKRGSFTANQGIFCPYYGGDGSNESQIRWKSDNTLQIYDSGGTNFNFITTQVFRDPSAWYHLVVAVDTTQATEANRFNLYINGEQISSFGTSTYPSQNFTTGWNGTSRHDIGRYAQGGNLYYGGYMAEVHQIDGTQLDPSYFGFTDPLTNTWRPKKVEGVTYGTNGFYFDYSDSSNLGTDRSGNGNDFAQSGFTTDDVVPDSPSGVSFSSAPTSGFTTTNSGPSNYCTLNPLSFGPSNADMLNGNLRFNTPTATYGNAKGTIAVSSGKWYWEVTPQTTATANVAGGILGADETSITSQPGAYATGYAYFGNGEKSHNGTETTYGATYGANDVIGTALDLDAGTLVFYKNGASQGIAFTGLSGSFVPSVGDTSSTSGVGMVCNFGQQDFAYNPPEGFKTLCLANLPRPTEAAVRPDKYVGIVTYIGASPSDKAVTGVGFAPEFVWIKARTQAYSHALYDTVRGATKELHSDTADAQDTDTNGLKSFDSDGFTVGSDGEVGDPTGTRVAWCWKAGGNPGISTTAFWKDDREYASAAAAGLDGGSITPIGASVGTKQGFSIISYRANLTQGATVSHGLTQAPDFAIFKNVDSTLGANEVDWGVYHRSLGATKNLELNQTLAAGTNAGPFNNTEPTSSVFTFGGNPDAFGHSYLTNGPSGDRFIAYIWHEVAGFSKFGSYSSNNSDNGPFIYTGFRPAWVMIKSYSSSDTYNWVVLDSERDKYNVMGTQLFPNTNGQDSTGVPNVLDFLSNGFKLRDDQNGTNGDTVDYIYAAFAAAPTNNLYGGQANAR